MWESQKSQAGETIAAEKKKKKIHSGIKIKRRGCTPMIQKSLVSKEVKGTRGGEGTCDQENHACVLRERACKDPLTY